MRERFCIRVTGRVQGVFYRATTKEVAEELGLKGFVRNEPDGSVYIEVEGNQVEVDQFIQWCKTGPRNAKVEEVTVKIEVFRGFERFEVRR